MKEKIQIDTHQLQLSPPNILVDNARESFFKRFDIWDILPYRWSIWYYDKIRPIFRPQHSRIRKSIPRQWRDIESLIYSVNFEMIKSFYEEEFLADIIDWDYDDIHRDFASWLKQAYQYITVERPDLEKQQDGAYPPLKDWDEMFETIETKNCGTRLLQLVDDDIPYETKYKEVNRLEQLIADKDTEVLTEMIKRRAFFWT